MESAAQLWVLEGLHELGSSVSPSPWYKGPHSRAAVLGELTWGWAHLETSVLEDSLQPPLPPLQKLTMKKKPFLAPTLSHLALIRGRMFFYEHCRVTEALENRNPLPLSQSKDCPMFA